MNKFFVSSFLIACLLLTYPINANSADTKNYLNNGRKIKLNIDLEKEKKLQTEVDSGHQPWRLESVDVAYAVVKANVDKDVKYEDCSLKSGTETEALVQCKNRRSYIILLKKLVKPDPNGIWTAISITETKPVK